MKRVIAIVVAALLALPLAVTAETIEPTTLEIWIGGDYITENEKKMPQEDWYFTRVCRRFEAANPGVTIEFMLQPDSEEMPQLFKAASAAGTEPDIVAMWSGQFVFPLEDILLDMRPYISQEDKDAIIGWETGTVDFVEGNAIIGFPALGNEVCGLIVNKNVTREVGLDFEANPPQSVDELMDAMQTIKDAGYLPLLSADSGWGRGFFFNFSSWWVQSVGSDRVASNSTGETKFADDEAFKQSFRIPAEMYSKGYINTDYMTLPNLWDVFFDGEAALVTSMNTHLELAIETLGEDNVAFINLPDLNDDVLVKDTCIGGPGKVLSVSKNTANPELAVSFISFYNNRENHLELLSLVSKLSLRTDISIADLGWEGRQVYQRMYELGEKYVFWADNSMKSNVCDELQKLGGLVITGKMSVDELAVELDNVAASQ